MKQIKTFLKILVVLLMLVCITPSIMADSPPSPPNHFSGDVFINDSDAPVGTIIKAYIDYPTDTIPDGIGIVEVAGEYEIDVILNSSIDEDKPITFKVINITSDESGDMYTKYGAIPRVLNLIAYDTTSPTIDSPTVAYPEGKSIVKNGDTVTVYANVTDDGSHVQTVSLNASAINSAASDVVMQEDDGSMYDWNDNDAADAGLYGATVVVNTVNNGEQTLSIEAVDYVGNHNSSEVVCNVDTVDPVVYIDPVTTPTNSSSQVINGTVTDANLDSVTVNGESATLDGNSYSATITLDDGSNTVTVNATDSAGNSGSNATTILLDTVDPTTSDDCPESWQNESFGVTLTPSDVGSGISATYYQIDDSSMQIGTSFTIETDGNHTVTYYSVDNASNVEDVNTIYAKLDTVDPVVYIDPVTTPTNSSSQVISGTVTDANLASVTVNGASADLDGNNYSATVDLTEGTNIISVNATDSAGNTGGNSTSVLLDTEAPTTDNNAPEEPAENPFTITFQPLDEGGSGVNATFYRIDAGEWIIGDSIDIYEAGEYSIEFYSDDIAGNKESTKTITVNLTESDTIPPVTTDNAPSGWQTESFTVNLSAIDEGGSGVNKTLYRMGDDWLSGNTILINTPGNHTIEYYSIDNAGNEESPKPKTTYAKYDPEPPVINEQNITPKSILNTTTDTATVTVNVTDPLSGLDNVTIDMTPIGESVSEMVSNGNNIYSYSYSIATNMTGDFSFNVTATDNAGNSVNTSLGLNVSTSDGAINEYSGGDGMSPGEIDQAIDDNEDGKVSDETVLVLIEEYFS
jgi:hypothetical protein